MERIRKHYQQDLPLAILFQAGTIASISKMIHENYQLGPWSLWCQSSRRGRNRLCSACIRRVAMSWVSQTFRGTWVGIYPVYGLQARGVIEGQEPHTCLRPCLLLYRGDMRGSTSGPYYLVVSRSEGSSLMNGFATANRRTASSNAVHRRHLLLRGPHYRRLRYALHVPFSFTL